MSHDFHFLERLERLDADGLDLALALYARADLVGEIIGRSAPPGAGRVAIALGEGERPPSIIAERDGHFVTCLGAGMAHDLPVISRAAVRVVAERHEQLRQKVAVSESLRRDPDRILRTMRVYEGPRLSREEAREINGWGLLLGRDYYQMWSRGVTDLFASVSRVRNAQRLRARHTTDVETAWEVAWMIGHLSAPCSHPLRALYATQDPAAPRFYRTLLGNTGIRTFLAGPALRCVWTLASMGELVIADLEGALTVDNDTSRTWGCVLTLVAMGLRSAALRPRVERALREPPAHTRPLRPEELETFARVREALFDPEKALRRHLAFATDWLQRRIGDVSALDERVIMAAAFYDDDLIADVETARRCIDMVPFVAASEWADLYLPRSVLARLPPEDREADARRYADRRRIYSQAERPQPVAAPPQIGRNEPCSCGSGKKWKRCCGAG